jgi:glycosyltransferase involved in cell wall biosynthesis
LQKPAVPRVSILLPAHDAAATLPACLASLARQTEPDWECVVVDDGSRDATAEIAGDFAVRDPRLRLLSQPHQGIVAALNAGLSCCRAPLVARMDADDLAHRDRLGAQADALDASPHLAAVGCHVRLFPRDSLTAGRRNYERWLNALVSPADVRRDAFVECPVAHPALMMRRDTLASLGYADVPWAEDYDLVLRALGAGHEIGVVPRRLVMWRDHPGRLSRVDARYEGPRFTACKAFHLARGFLAPGDQYVLWGYGDTGRTLRRALLAHGKSPSHIVEIKRTRIGQKIHGTPVVAPEALVGVRGVPIVVSVAHAGPRAEIRAALARMGFIDGADYVCAA